MKKRIAELEHEKAVMDRAVELACAALEAQEICPNDTDPFTRQCVVPESEIPDNPEWGSCGDDVKGCWRKWLVSRAHKELAAEDHVADSGNMITEEKNDE